MRSSVIHARTLTCHAAIVLAIATGACTQKLRIDRGDTAEQAVRSVLIAAAAKMSESKQMDVETARAELEHQVEAAAEAGDADRAFFLVELLNTVVRGAPVEGARFLRDELAKADAAKEVYSKLGLRGPGTQASTRALEYEPSGLTESGGFFKSYGTVIRH